MPSGSEAIADVGGMSTKYSSTVVEGCVRGGTFGGHRGARSGLRRKPLAGCLGCLVQNEPNLEPRQGFHASNTASGAVSWLVQACFSLDSNHAMHHSCSFKGTTPKWNILVVPYRTMEIHRVFQRLPLDFPRMHRHL